MVRASRTFVPTLHSFQLSPSVIVPLCLSEFRTNGLYCSSQSAQFKDFLLRANKYNWLKIVGDDESTEKKLILVEVCGIELLGFSWFSFHKWDSFGGFMLITTVSRCFGSPGTIRSMTQSFNNSFKLILFCF